MKLAVVGSRTFSDYTFLGQVIDRLSIEKGLCISTIVSGGARGVDSMAAIYAREHDIELLEFLPNYKKYGRRAPLLRNEEIISSSDVVLALWDGKSRGTSHSINIAKEMGKELFIERI